MESEVQLDDHPLLVAVDDKVIEEELSKEEEEEVPMIGKERLLSLLIVTHGTRGDVEPFIAFAEEVAAKRGRVALCSNVCHYAKVIPSANLSLGG